MEFPRIVPVIPGFINDLVKPPVSRLAACGACGCADQPRHSRVVNGSGGVPMLSILCNDAHLCARTFRAGMTEIEYGKYLLKGETL